MSVSTYRRDYIQVHTPQATLGTLRDMGLKRFRLLSSMSGTFVQSDAHTTLFRDDFSISRFM